jgi:hypothetical protein
MNEPVVSDPEVGEFRLGTAFSRWALARYLVGRSLLDALSRGLLIAGLVILGSAALLWFGPDAHSWAIFFGVWGVGVLLLRGLLVLVLRRVTATREFGPIENGLRRLVADTRRGVLRELRAVGLPSHLWTLPLLGVRLLRPRKRRDTIARLRQFNVDRVVPASRVDEVHMMLRQVVRR